MRPILIFSLLLFFTGNLICQTSIGVKFGFNISNIVISKSADNVEEFDELEAVHFGVVGNFTLSKKLELQAEIFAISKGNDARGVGASFQLLHNYIATPVLLKYEVVPKLSILGGFEPSYLFSSYWANGLEFQNVSELFEENRKLDLGLAAGLAFKFAKRWSLDIRYTRGVLFANSESFRVHNRSFYFSIHRYFGG